MTKKNDSNKSISINRILDGRLKEYVYSVPNKGLPNYTGPEIINRMVLYFLASVTKDEEMIEAVRRLEDVEVNVKTTVAKVLENMGLRH